MNIFIYGVPGSGKTTLAKLLSKSSDLDYFEADLIRKDVQKGKNAKVNPFYFLPTTEAYKALGKRTKQNIVKGMLNVRFAFKKSIDKKVSSCKKDIILESAFLDPESLKNKGFIFLLIIPSKIQHKRQFLVHRSAESLVNGQFENARIIQDFFVAEAKRLGVIILKNNGNTHTLIKEVDLVLNNYNKYTS